MLLFDTLTSNISGKPKIKQLDGRDHLVVPMTMLVPGVLNGSRGRGLYTKEESSRDVDSWNGMPIVVNHPSDEQGNAISARDPEVLNKYGVGKVFNANWKNKLRAMAWVDIEKAKVLIPKELSLLQQGKPVELSTGLFTENQPVKNGRTEDGKEYDWAAKNLKPDHLALLTSAKGACSLIDGCGLNINSEPTADELSPYVDWDEFEEIVSNQLSHEDLRQQLDKQIKHAYGASTYVVDVFDKKAVYCVYPRGTESTGIGAYGPDEHYEIGYTTDLRTSKVTLTGNPTKVIRETVYKPVTNSEDKSSVKMMEMEECHCGGECDKCKEEAKKKMMEIEEPVKNALAKVSPQKACTILEDGEVNGQPITKKQRGMFGAICGKTNNSDSQQVALALAKVDNSFCPTGKGGGIDPTCGKSGGGASGGVADGYRGAADAMKSAGWRGSDASVKEIKDKEVLERFAMELKNRIAGPEKDQPGTMRILGSLQKAVDKQIRRLSKTK